LEEKDINLTYNDQQIEVLLKEKAKIRGMAIEIKSQLEKENPNI